MLLIPKKNWVCTIGQMLLDRTGETVVVPKGFSSVWPPKGCLRDMLKRFLRLVGTLVKLTVCHVAQGLLKLDLSFPGKTICSMLDISLESFFDPNPNVFDVDGTVNRIPGRLASDSRNVYDKLQTEELSIKGQERRVVSPERNPKRKLRRSPGDESVSALQSDVHASGAHRPSLWFKKILFSCTSQGEISHSHIRWVESCRVL